MTPPLQRLQEATGTAEPTTNRPTESFSDPDSLSGHVDAVHRAFSRAFPSDDDGGYNYVEEIYEDRVLARLGEDVVQVAYTTAADNTVTFGEPEKVKVTLSVAAVAEAAAAAAGGEPERIRGARAAGTTLLEALDGDEGRVWRVTMVRPGISKNGRRYSPAVLQEAAHLYEGTRSFDGHRDPAERRRSAVGGMAGWHENVEVAGDGSLVSEFHIAESRDDVRQLFLTAWRNQRPDLIGFSHDVSAIQEPAVVNGRRISDVRKIVEVHSVDIVADPSAGGSIERLVASRQEEDTMTLEQFLRALRAGDLTAEQIAEAYSEHPEWEQITEAAGATPPAPADPPAPAPATITEAAPAAADAPLTGLVRDMAIAHAMDQANLPEAARARLVESFDGTETEEQIRARITETATLWDAALAARPSPLPGQVASGQDDAEKMQEALDAMIAGVPAGPNGVPAYRSLKQAYSAFTGRHPFAIGDEDFNRWLLAESVGGVPYAGASRVTESMTSASWAEALGDSITRRLVAEYQFAPLQSWRQIVSEIGNLNDFRTNRRVRVGGYNTLPTVAEADPYVALTSPTDEEATYAPTKKGGTEDYTLEMVANDDLGALRRIPQKLGRAAALTLYRLIWNTIIAGNATIYDTVALFHNASHTNDNATTPLAEAGISTLRQRMMRQQVVGETSGFVGLMPRFLVVPPELYSTAFKLAESAVAVVSGENATTPNPYRNLEVIEVPTLTDANDWYLVADPGSVPTIEVGFYQGRQDPELFIADQPTVGTVFTHDKFTWKIRHIYGAAVLDYRGFQRATNA